MKKLLGITILLLVVCGYTAWRQPNFLSAYNLQNTVRWTSLFGIIAIGVAFPIITGGIDLSIGSVVGLIGAMLPWLLVRHEWSLGGALAAVLGLSLLIGLFHGLLITKLRLQSFIVTLCGLLLYRGIVRWLTDDATQGFGVGYKTLKQLVKGNIVENSFIALRWLNDELGLHLGLPASIRPAFDLPMVFLLLVIVAVAAGFFLNFTIWGRYLLALGRNEEAARFSGIRTDRMIIVSYVICSGLAGVAGVLFAVDVNAVQPSGFGNFYELYAIAAAVLGGCSLRGGEGSILGVIIGTALMRVLYNAINMLRIPTQLEFAIIGVVILGGVIADELVKRLAARRRIIAEARESASAPPAAPVVGGPVKTGS